LPLLALIELCHPGLLSYLSWRILAWKAFTALDATAACGAFSSEINPHEGLKRLEF
jgi:hypothetical protein